MNGYKGNDVRVGWAMASCFLCVLRDDGEFLLYVWGVICVKTYGYGGS